MEDKSIIILGAGFAGLSAGIYAQMNGYQSQIYEMGDLPGGLCTAWRREGYTIDGCIHWLVGSSPKSGMYRFWQEVGVVQERQFVNADQYMRFEGADGRTFVLYANVEQLEKHMLELSPQDAEATRQLVQDIRLGIAFDLGQPLASDSALQRTVKQVKLGLLMAGQGKRIQELMRTSTLEYVRRFKDPLIRQALEEMWMPEFSVFFMLFTLAYLHNQNAGT
jgi:phytoene dehydrogenase-like protein